MTRRDKEFSRLRDYETTRLPDYQTTGLENTLVYI